MTDQSTVTEEAIDQAARVIAFEHGSSVFDDDHEPHEFTEVEREQYRAEARAAAEVLAPHIAAGAFRRAAAIVEQAGRNSTSTDPDAQRAIRGFAAGAGTALRIAANAEEIGARPGTAAPTRTTDARTCIGCGDDVWPGEQVWPTGHAGALCAICQTKDPRMPEPDDVRHRDCPAAHCGSWALHGPHGDCPGTTRS